MIRTISYVYFHALLVVGSYLEGVEILKTINLPSNDLGSIHTTTINNTHYIAIARASTDADSTVGTCGLAYVLECSDMPHCNVLQSFNTNAVVLEFFDYNNQSALLVDHKVKSTLNLKSKVVKFFKL